MVDPKIRWWTRGNCSKKDTWKTLQILVRISYGKGTLEETRYMWCVQVLRSPKEEFAAAMQSWRERCEKCVCLQGDYSEKWLHFQLPVVSSFLNKLGDLRTWTPHVTRRSALFELSHPRTHIFHVHNAITACLSLNCRWISIGFMPRKWRNRIITRCSSNVNVAISVSKTLLQLDLVTGIQRVVQCRHLASPNLKNSHVSSNNFHVSICFHSRQKIRIP